MTNQQSIVLYTAKWCPLCKKIRRFLDASNAPYCEIDVEAPGAGGTRPLPLEGMQVPAVRVGEDLLTNPSEEELASKLEISLPEIEMFDIAIVGGGPAGLTASIYAARERLKVVVLEKGVAGGQAALTDRIENYPGFPDPVGGVELMDRVGRQAEKMGAVIRLYEEVKEVGQSGCVFKIKTSSGEILAGSVIAAPGSSYRRLNVPGEEEFVGKGVSFCATCDAPFYKGKHVVVAGGGNSALQETVHLAEFASRLTLVQALDHLTGSKVLVDRVNAVPFVEVLLSHRIVKIFGSAGVEGVELENKLTKKISRLNCDGVFVFVGMRPSTDFLKNLGILDEQGFILTNPETLETPIPGLFAAGDARAESSKQITSAVGEGTVALFNALRHLRKRSIGK